MVMTLGSFRVATHGDEVAEVLGHPRRVAAEPLGRRRRSTHPPWPANQRGVVKW